LTRSGSHVTLAAALQDWIVTMERRWDVLGFGAVAVDELVYVERHPDPDGKVPVQAHRREGGGLTGTALVAVARLGGRAAYCGVLGTDELSQYTLRELERAGVDCSCVIRQPGAGPIHSFVIVVPPTSQRTVLAFRDDFVARPPETITEDLVGACRVLFVDHVAVEPALRAAQLARVRGVPVVADLESDCDSALVELMELVDHLIVGIHFAQRATGRSTPEEAVRALARRDRACTVVTAGARGCLYSEYGGEVQTVPALQVPVVDTTGCGDVFHGAYAVCIARGMEPNQAILVANITAGIKATCPGGRGGIPDWGTVERVLAGCDLS
jgi:sugar/nucleoside kinase (ribokinase family)